MHYSKNKCKYNRSANRKKCKWFCKNDYILSDEESEEILNNNKKNRKKKISRKNYGGFENVKLVKVDLSKYKEYR